jgi:vacuolar-type H+-ATPase catalytic subunit A/Vma1
VELGPGILNNIFDGIQRPLKQIAMASGDCFIPRGVAVPALDPKKAWDFQPTGFKACGRKGSTEGREGREGVVGLFLLAPRSSLVS